MLMNSVWIYLAKNNNFTNIMSLLFQTIKHKCIFQHSRRTVHNSLTILDGSMGSYLQNTGVPKNQKIWSANSLTESKYHKLVINAHKEYLKCGANVITTNNYSCIPVYLSRENREHQMLPLTRIAIDLAFQAKTEYLTEFKDKLFINQQNNNIKIAGCIPPLSDNHSPNRLLSQHESLKYYSMIINELYTKTKYGMIDILLCETMSCIKEVLFALKAIVCYQSLSSNNKINEIWISFSMKEDGTLRSNETFNEMIKELEPWFDICNIKIISMNCCFPEAIDIALNNLCDESIQILKTHNVKLGMYPNGITFIGTNNELHTVFPRREDLSPKILYDKFYKKWLSGDNGEYIGMIGGCCNITPPFIQYAVQQIVIDFPHLLKIKSNY
eukprot:286583_1